MDRNAAITWSVFWIALFGCIASVSIVNRLHEVEPRANPADVAWVQHCAKLNKSASIYHVGGDTYECK